MPSILVPLCLISLALLVHYNTGIITGRCQAPNEWKTWLNTNRPTVLGEFEIVPHYQKLFAGQPFVCANPTGIEAKTVDDREPSTTGDTFRLTLNEGFYCLNQIIKPRKKNCTDYKIRFCCPA